MKTSVLAAAVLSFVATAFSTDNSNISAPLTSSLVLPSTFAPPKVFTNLNLVHVINLEKSYPKESINVVIENTSQDPQDEYYIPFTAEQISRVGTLEVTDRKVPELGNFKVDSVEFDPTR